MKIPKDKPVRLSPKPKKEESLLDRRVRIEQEKIDQIRKVTANGGIYC